MIERVAKKGDLTDEDFEQLQNSIDTSAITDLLTEDEFNRAIFQLVRHVDLQNADVIERLKRIEAKLDDKSLQTPIRECNFVPEPDRFVGREDMLKKLDQAFSGTDEVALIAVKGIGGIGKSTLAKEFAKRNKRVKLKLWAELGQTASEDLLSRILRYVDRRRFPTQLVTKSNHR